MKTLFRLISTSTLLAFGVLTLSSCQTSDSGGSSSGSETYTTPTAAAGSSSLKLSSKVSVVDAQDDATFSGKVSPGSGSLSLNFDKISEEINRTINTGSFAADSDYNQDQTEFWVHEDSVQAFNTVNEILCSIAQTKYDEMKGLGNYRAQIDSSACSSSKDSASDQIQNSQNQSSSSGKTEYEEWVVNSDRVENEPHIVKVWVSETAKDAHDKDKMILAKLEIYQSASETNPFGFFVLNFIGYPVDAAGEADTTQEPEFRGYMRTVVNSAGDTLLQFSNNMSFGSDSISEQATFSRSSDGSSGSGTLSAPKWDGPGIPALQVYNIAYNDTHFLRQKDDDTAQCYDRNDFDTTVWDYSMYDNVGARVQMDSGFPIKYAPGSEEYYGWVGYHGLWLPDDASISHGDTVLKQEWNNDTTTETPYTVFIAGGRLIKHTRKTMTLGDLKNVPLQWGEFDSGLNEWVEYRIAWNGTVLQKTATLDRENWTWTELSTPIDLDLTGEWSFHFWSEALGGSGSVNIKDAAGTYSAPTSSTAVIFHTQDMVYPTDTVPATLVCFDQCPDPTQLADTTASSLSFNDDNWYFDGAPNATNYRQYTFDSATMLLQYSGTDVVMTAANTAQPWGFHSGMLFEPTAGNLTTVACDWNASKTCNWQGWDRMTVYYTWETGPEQWNKFTAIKNGSNVFEKFDPPMKVSYTHTQTDTAAYDYKYNGAKFQLEYQGFGNLHGIPGRCIDKDTGASVSCDGNVRWIPEFSIVPGTTVTNIVDGTTEYVVKPLHGEQRMSNVAVSNCGSMSLTTFALPGLDDWADPEIGARPAVTDAPAVIGGVVQ
jgi:hypothetical protein